MMHTDCPFGFNISNGALDPLPNDMDSEKTFTSSILSFVHNVFKCFFLWVFKHRIVLYVIGYQASHHIVIDP